MKTFNVEYKDHILEVEINPINSITGLLIPYIKGTCDCISFVKSGYYKNEDYSEIVNSFIKEVDLLTESKKEGTSHTHLLTQLDRLAKKDKETNFTPFELRGQLIEIYHLFGKILSLTLEDIHKLYFERAEG